MGGEQEAWEPPGPHGADGGGPQGRCCEPRTTGAAGPGAPLRLLRKDRGASARAGQAGESGRGRGERERAPGLERGAAGAPGWNRPGAGPGAAPALRAQECWGCFWPGVPVGQEREGCEGCEGEAGGWVGLAPDSDLKLSGSRLFPSNPAWIPHTETECQFTALSPAPFP